MMNIYRRAGRCGRERVAPFGYFPSGDVDARHVCERPAFHAGPHACGCGYRWRTAPRRIVGPKAERSRGRRSWRRAGAA